MSDEDKALNEANNMGRPPHERHAEHGKRDAIRAGKA